MLNILKKYMLLKENFFKNKQKYKSILFLLSKMRKINNENTIEDHTIDKIEQLLDSQNSENININLEEISNEEKEELKNFDVSEDLLKDIESSLMTKINKLFEEDKNDNNNIYIKEISDKKNDIIDKNSTYNELGIDKIDNIQINNNSIS